MTQLDIQMKVATSRPRAIDTLLQAFEADQATRWVWPEAATFRAIFPEFVYAFGGAAFEHATAYQVDDYAGAALWLRPGAHPDEEALGALLERTVPSANLPGVFVMFEQMAAFHPAQPCWYLPLAGVRPEHQCKGYGAALLAPMLERCDRERTPVYLEATSPRSARLYARLGFEPLAKIPAGPTIITPMVRKPR